MMSKTFLAALIALCANGLLFLGIAVALLSAPDTSSVGAYMLPIAAAASLFVSARIAGLIAAK